MHPKCVLMMLAAICLAPTWAGAQDTKGFVQGVGGIRLTSAPGTAGSVGGTVGGYITFAGAHRLLDAGVTGRGSLRRVTQSATTGILIASLMRVVLFLAALGIRTVIDLTQDGEAQESGLVERAGMKFYRIPMTTHETPSSEKIAQFLALVDNPANQPVYVHCQGGRHRTGVMTAVYRMTNDGWAADRAFAEMKQYKFGPDFLHSEFKEFVYGYHADAARTASARAAVGAKAGGSE